MVPVDFSRNLPRPETTPNRSSPGGYRSVSHTLVYIQEVDYTYTCRENYVCLRMFFASFMLLPHNKTQGKTPHPLGRTSAAHFSRQRAVGKQKNKKTPIRRVYGQISTTSSQSPRRHVTCVAPPTKKCHFADFLHKSTTGSTCTCVFFLYVPSLCRNFSYTFGPKMHNLAMDS